MIKKLCNKRTIWWANYIMEGQNDEKRLKIVKRLHNRETI